MELSYKYWCSLSDDELAQRDVAETNLFAAYNLPYAGKLEIADLQKQLDQWAERVDDATRRAIARGAPELRQMPFGQFRILVMVSVLQRSLGVRYNFGFMEGEYDGSDSRNLFIHGLLQGHGGSCVTLPVLYAAIGRRLGYPIKLVQAKEHTFCRWSEPGGERFNIEATSPGFTPRSDEYYLTWPVPITPAELKSGFYLRELTPREELAFFLGQRGNCWFDNLDGWWAAEAYREAYKLTNQGGYHIQWGEAIILHRAMEQIKQQAEINPWSMNLRMPKPKEEWEKQLYPRVQKHLQRILANKKQRLARSAHDNAIQELVPIQTN